MLTSLVLLILVAEETFLFIINTVVLISIFKMFIFLSLAEPLPLMDLCRLKIRQTVGKENLTPETLDSFDIPRQMKQYLVYKW